MAVEAEHGRGACQAALTMCSDAVLAQMAAAGTARVAAHLPPALAQTGVREVY